MQGRFEEISGQVLRSLRRHGIHLANPAQLSPPQSDYLAAFFRNQVLPKLDPILLDPARPLPKLADGALYLGVKMDSGIRHHYGLLKVPGDRLPRFVALPMEQAGGAQVFVLLENIIRHHLGTLFRDKMAFKYIGAHGFTVTLSALLSLSADLEKAGRKTGGTVDRERLARLARSLRTQQDRAETERITHDRRMPDDLLDFLKARLPVPSWESFSPGGACLNARDFIEFPGVDPQLEYAPLPPLDPPAATGNLMAINVTATNVMAAMEERDLLLHYPYHSFERVIDLLNSAALDPAVESIEITLYRVARHSRVVDALLRARAKGKRVTAVVELQARFDEAANLAWARRLSEADIKVIVGPATLKVHSKLILIRRREARGIRYFSHVGTGNFNEQTAGTYTDFSLLSCSPAVGRDVEKIFRFIAGDEPRPTLEQLWLSPLTTRPALEKRIAREIAHGLAGLPAAITLKCNNLVDRNIIGLLYRASSAGVHVRVICRGMCSLIPGVSGVSDNIEVISIVDRFLEHPRVFVFHNGGDPEVFISSADIMARNLDHRVEASAPVTDSRLKQRILDILDIQWCDNQKARQVNRHTPERRHEPGIRGKLNAQSAIHHYLATGQLPVEVARARNGWRRELQTGADSGPLKTKKTAS